MSLINKIRGCLIAGAIGDSFGYNIEFHNTEEIIKLYGKNGLSQMIQRNGKYIVSDDTQMTLFTLEGILLAKSKNISDINESIFYSYLRWFDTQFGPNAISDDIANIGKLHNIKELFYMRDPGHACIDSLRHRNTIIPTDFTNINSINISKGCGAVMKTAPIGFLIRLQPSDIFKISYNCAAITHGDEEAKLAATLFSLIIYNILKDNDIKMSIEFSCKTIEENIDIHCLEWVHIKELLNIVLNSYYNMPCFMPDYIDKLGEGWLSAEALCLGIHAFLWGGNDLFKVISIAANRTGDSDSIASIAGNLYGTYYGFDNINEKLYDKLEFKDIILNMANDFYMNLVM